VRKCTASALPNPTDVHHIWRVGEPRRPEPSENPLGELMHKSPHPTTLGRDGFVRLCAQAAPRLFRQSRSDMGHETEAGSSNCTETGQPLPVWSPMLVAGVKVTARASRDPRRTFEQLVQPVRRVFFRSV
jgi:hypothetical protein